MKNIRIKGKEQRWKDKDGSRSEYIRVLRVAQQSRSTF